MQFHKKVKEKERLEECVLSLQSDHKSDVAELTDNEENVLNHCL